MKLGHKSKGFNREMARRVLKVLEWLPILVIFIRMHKMDIKPKYGHVKVPSFQKMGPEWGI